MAFFITMKIQVANKQLLKSILVKIYKFCFFISATANSAARAVRAM